MSQGYEVNIGKTCNQLNLKGKNKFKIWHAIWNPIRANSKQQNQRGGNKMVRWDLFKEMESMSRGMNDVLRGIDSGRRSLEKVFYPELTGSGLPKLNVYQDEDNIYVEALLPGIKPEAMEMNVLRNTLTLSGERQVENQKEGQHVYHRRERGGGKFMRTIELPYSIDSSKAEATYKDGLLRVKLPKSEEAKPKKVLVKAA
jgi:HSP20 family protein